jgi:hypothetical protein
LRNCWTPEILGQSHCVLQTIKGIETLGHIDEHFERYPSTETQYKKANTAGSTKVGVQMLDNLWRIRLINL